MQSLILKNKNMKKITLLVSLTILSLGAIAQPFMALYDFAGVTDTTGTTDPSAVPVITGVTFGSFSATGTPANPATGTLARFNFTGWSTGSVGGMADTLYSGMTGAVADTEYYEVTIGPAAGYTLNIDSIKFAFERSATGVRTYAVRSSVDGFVSNLSANYVFLTQMNTNVFVQPGNEFFLKKDITTIQNRNQIILGGMNFSLLSAPVTFRFYGWNSEGGTGTFSIDNVRFIGSRALAVGIKENATDAISVSPNPSSNGLFNLDLGKTTGKTIVSVNDIIGNVVVTKEINANGKQTLDLSNVANGSYFINFKNDSSISTKKITINK